MARKKASAGDAENLARGWRALMTPDQEGIFGIARTRAHNVFGIDLADERQVDDVTLHATLAPLVALWERAADKLLPLDAWSQFDDRLRRLTGLKPWAHRKGGAK